MSNIPSKIFLQNEGTAAERTFDVHLTLAADGADATGLTPAVTLSKAGAAFGAMAGAITELANGWYKVVLTAADLDTIGDLAVRVTGTLADPAEGAHQVAAFDLNTPLASSGLATSAAVAALATKQKTVPYRHASLLTTDGQVAACSMLNAIDAVISISGTWDGATATIQTTVDPGATTPLWTTIASGAKTADAVATIVGPISAWRVIISNDGAATSLQVSALARFAA